MKKGIISLVIAAAIVVQLCSLNTLQAQQFRQSGWYMGMNTFRLNDKFIFFFDAQLRSTDKWRQSETFIFRPAVGYLLNKNAIISLGVASVTNWRTFTYSDIGTPLTIRDAVDDNRIWQQLIVNQAFRNRTLQHRLRLEERWLGTLTRNGQELELVDRKLNARFRYFTRLIVPFKEQSPFTQGWFAALQNEFFFNVIGSAHANRKFFDQSRTYGGIGYRLSSKVDLEWGYMAQYVVQRQSPHIFNNIAQLSSFLRL